MTQFHAALIDGIIRAIPMRETESLIDAARAQFPNAAEIQDAYSARLQLVSGLSPVSADAAQSLMDKAHAYVWGWLDAGGDRYDGAADSWAFGAAYGVYVAQFYAGTRSSHMAIQDAFKLWCADHVIGDPYKSFK